MAATVERDLDRGPRVKGESLGLSLASSKFPKFPKVSQISQISKISNNSQIFQNFQTSIVTIVFNRLRYTNGNLPQFHLEPGLHHQHLFLAHFRWEIAVGTRKRHGFVQHRCSNHASEIQGNTILSILWQSPQIFFLKIVWWCFRICIASALLLL